MRYFQAVLCFAGILLGSSHAQGSNSTNTTLSVSLDGSCGASVNQTCLKSSYGDCCSARGFCGGTSDYCTPSNGCQTSFGICSTTSAVISVDGRCGSQDPLKQVCIGSVFGSCCSVNGWCGNTTTYCGQGCQSGAGTCGGAGITINTGSNATSSSSSSSNNSSGNPTYTLPAASSTSSSPSDATSSELETTKSSLKATQAGLGVVAALLVISLMALVWLVLTRKRKQRASPVHDHIEKPLTDVERTPTHSSHTPIAPANMMSAVSEAPHPSYHGAKRWPYTRVEAHELGTTTTSAELTGNEKIYDTKN